MAGVAGPMLRESRGRGARFLAGLLVGGVAAGIVLAIPVYLLGQFAQTAVPLRGRLLGVAAICVLLGIADLRNRTPHVWRQVPQRLVHVLPPATLGLAWGFDLGLLFTTQKVVSLIWVAVAAVMLLDPTLAAGALVVIAVVSTLAIAGWSVAGRSRTSPVTRWERLGQRRVRQASGVAMLILFALTAVQAWTP
jgi:hypothetical protein